MDTGSGDMGGVATSRWRRAMWGGAALLLLLPLVAMRFTAEVAWTGLDFAVFGTMLAVACGTCEGAARLSRNGAYRAGAGVAVLAGFLLVWANLAVGMIGDEGDPANLAHAAVLLVAVAGAFAARAQAAGMARAMLATATVQALTVLATWMLGWRHEAVLTCFFVAMWLLSAWLFRRAAVAQARPVA